MNAAPRPYMTTCLPRWSVRSSRRITTFTLSSMAAHPTKAGAKHDHPPGAFDGLSDRPD